MRQLVLMVVMLAWACGQAPNSSADAGPVDSGEDFDAGPVDAGTVDADLPDAGPVDAGPTLAELLEATWTKLENAPAINGKQDDVYFVDENEGWSVNGLGEIHHTENGGATWTRQVTQPGTYFRSILFLDRLHGFAGNIGTDYFPGVTDTTPLYETKNGGVTWTKVTTITGPKAKGICNMHKIDSQNLVAVGRVGGPAFMLKSSDAGATWKSSDLSGSIHMLIDVRFTTPLDGFIVGSNAEDRAVILSTTDGGETWSKTFETEPGKLAWKISFPSEKVGYVSLQFTKPTVNGSFLKTVDGGKTWTELPFLNKRYSAKGIGFITEDIGWIGGEVTAYRTNDGGKTWNIDYSLGRYVNRFRFIGQRTGYAIGATIEKLSIPPN
jgi:photosystem II stability/assembly factor-like uncharacterized protein